MTDHLDLMPLRRYTRREAAAMLNIFDTWLKVWVTADLVPHQRSGRPGPRQRGVWFTYQDILEIGGMLPDLMSGRRANQRAERSPTHDEDISAPQLDATALADDGLLESFAGLRSIRAQG